MDSDEDVYVDIVDENPEEAGDDRYGGKEVMETGEFDRWNGGRYSDGDDDDYDDGYKRYGIRSKYEYVDYGHSGSGKSKLKSVVVQCDDYERGGSEHCVKESGDKEGSSSTSKLPSLVSHCDGKRSLESSRKEFGEGSRRSSKHVSVINNYDHEHVPGYTKQERRDDGSSRMSKISVISDYDSEQVPEYSKERGDKKCSRSYRHKVEVETDDSDYDLEQFSKKHSKQESVQKEHQRSSKRKIVAYNDDLDDDVELYTKSTKYSDESHFHKKPKERKSSFQHAKSESEEKLEKDPKGKEKHTSRHGMEIHEWLRNHGHEGRLSVEREKRERVHEKLKERSMDDEDKGLKISRKSKSTSTKHRSEHDNYWERERSWETQLMERENDSREQIRDSNRERKLTKREKESDLRGQDKRNVTNRRDRELVETGKERYSREDGEVYWEESQTSEKVMASKKRSGITDLMGRNSRTQDRETKGESYVRVPVEGEKGKGSREQDRGSLDSGELCERKSRLQDTDYMEKSQQIKGYRESRETKGKNHLSEEVRKHDRDKREKSWAVEEMHPENKMTSREQDINIREESHEKESEREIKERSWKRDYVRTDLRKQYPMERMHAVKGTKSMGQDRKILEESHEKEWDKENKEGSRKEYFFGRDSINETENQNIHIDKGQHLTEHGLESREGSQESDWEREKREKYGRRDFSHSDARSRNREIKEKIWEREKEEEHRERERKLRNNEKSETSHRWHLLERDTWKHDKETREKSREREVMHSVKERDITMHDLESLEKNQEVEVVDRGNVSRRDQGKMDREMIQEDEPLDRQTNRDSRVRERRGKENSLERESVEKRKVRELWAEEDHCRYNNLFVEPMDSNDMIIKIELIICLIQLGELRSFKETLMSLFH